MTDDVRLDVEAHLLSRVVDRADAPRDWDDLQRLAGDDPALWQRLAYGLRDDCVLRTALSGVVARADAVELPAATPVTPPPAPPQPAAEARVGRRERASAAMGWAAALFLALAWWLHAGGSDRGVVPGTHAPEPLRPEAISVDHVASEATPSPALDDVGPAPVDPVSLDAGLAALTAPARPVDGSDADVVVEFPKQLLETRTLPDGRVEVLYIRRSVEREVVQGAWALTEDDLGRLQPVPVDLAALSPSELL